MEQWKDIKGYEGLYKVSDSGRVINIKTDLILTQTINEQGYLTVGLRKNYKTTRYKIHRLVAVAFIPNPLLKEQINHIDEDKNNNFAANLEWSTPSENTNHATGNYRRMMKLGNRVYQYDLSGVLINTWNSVRECGRNGYSKSAIGDACNNGKAYYGYSWSY